MRQHGRIRWVTLLFGALLMLSGCGSETASSETPVTAAPPPDSDPLESIPPEEIYGISPAANVQLPRYEMEVPGLPAGWAGARFAIISDMQLGLWEGNEEVAAAAVRKAVEANPDMILLLGDFIARGADTSSLMRVLEPLKGRRTLAVLGDRDVRTDTLEAAILTTLQSAGVQVLSNSSVAIQRQGGVIFIAGLDPDILTKSWNEQKYLLAIAGEPGRTPILMTHVAAMATRAPKSRYPVVVSGGTFCGEVEVPGSPRLDWLREEVFPSARIEGREKLFRVLGNTILITCGTGYGFVPLQYGAAPEVAILTIVPLETAAEEAAAPVIPDSIMTRYQGAADDTSGSPGQ